MNMNVCAHLHINICTYVRMYVCRWVDVYHCVPILVRTYVCVYVYVHYVYKYVDVDMYVYYVHVHVLYISMDVYMYIDDQKCTKHTTCTLRRNLLHKKQGGCSPEDCVTVVARELTKPWVQADYVLGNI